MRSFASLFKGLRILSIIKEGVTEPQATFSSCFGAPFLVWHPVKYASMLAEKMSMHQADAWLVNTGWNGGAYGVGKRISLKYSRAIIDSINSGELAKAEFENYSAFNLQVPKACVGVPSEILNPAKTWTGTKESYDSTLKKLATLFCANFEQFKEKGMFASIVAFNCFQSLILHCLSLATADILQAGPKI